MFIQLLDFPEDVGRPQTFLTPLRFRRMELQELLFIWAATPRSLSTRMRQWVHEISVGAPPRSPGSWVG